MTAPTPASSSSSGAVSWRSRPMSSLRRLGCLAIAFLVFVEGRGRDFYKILGVAKNADAPAIKKAYRKKALKMHPDKVPADATEKQKAAQLKKFQELSNAYETLSDPKKRKNYDQFGEDPTRPGQAAEGGGSAEDIFSQFFGGGFKFGGGGGGRKQQQAPEQLYEDEDDVSEVQSFEDFQKIKADSEDYYGDQFVVKFYSSGCKACHDMKPHFIKVAKAFDKAVHFFAVSCNRHQKVCKKYGVSKYPTIKFFGPKEMEETYKGANDKKTFETWVSKTMPDKTTRIKTVADMEKFNSDDSQARVILFVDKPNTPPRLQLMSMTHRVHIGVVSRKQAPKVFKAYKMPAAEQKTLPLFLDVQSGEWSKKSADDIPEYLQAVQKVWREDRATAKYDELTTAALSSGKCAASDSKYCVLVVGSDGRTKTFSDIFLGAANDMFKDPVRVFSVHPTKDITLKKKLSPILLQLTEDPSIVLWRPKRQRWTVFPPAGGKSFVALVKSGKAREEVVQWVRGQIDGGGQLPNRHEEL